MRRRENVKWHIYDSCPRHLAPGRDLSENTCSLQLHLRCSTYSFHYCPDKHSITTPSSKSYTSSSSSSGKSNNSITNTFSLGRGDGDHGAESRHPVHPCGTR